MSDDNAPEPITLLNGYPQSDRELYEQALVWFTRHHDKTGKAPHADAGSHMLEHAFKKRLSKGDEQHDMTDADMVRVEGLDFSTQLPGGGKLSVDVVIDAWPPATLALKLETDTVSDHVVYMRGAALGSKMNELMQALAFARAHIIGGKPWDQTCRDNIGKVLDG